MFRRIDHVEIVPKDLETSIRFYSDVLGFRLKSRRSVSAPPMHEVVYLTLGDTMLELIGADVEAVPDPERWSVGFRGMALEVEDMTAALDALGERGIPAVWGPADLGDSFRAEIRDPDGLIVELRQWKQG
jgi:glyoxylase I family protein